MVMTLSKRQSKARPLENDPAALETLFHANWERVCRLLYRLTGDWDEAQDLALETFFQFHRNPPGVDTNLEGWLYRVAWRLGLNALRAQKRRQSYEQAAEQQMIAEKGLSHNRQLEENIQRQIEVRKALSVLPPRSAQLLLLRYSGFSYAEIAAIMEIAPTSIGTLLARAEKEFEQVFEA